MITVLIVDDHELIRIGISKLLADVKNIKVIGQATSGENAVLICRKLKPDVILMDINMPGIGGLEAMRKILRISPDTKIIVLTVYGDEPFPSRFLQAGAYGYLTKGCTLDEMVQAIHHTFSGQKYLSPKVAQQLALKHLGTKDSSPLELLSDRELQIMLMITKGIKVSEISDKLCLSPKTVNSYRYRIFEKLKINSDVELTHLALRHGLLVSEKVS